MLCGIVFHKNLFDPLAILLGKAVDGNSTTNYLYFYIGTDEVLIYTYTTDKAESQYVLIYTNHGKVAFTYGYCLLVGIDDDVPWCGGIDYFAVCS